jgi:hypothetical protein
MFWTPPRDYMVPYSRVMKRIYSDTLRCRIMPSNVAIVSVYFGAKAFFCIECLIIGFLSQIRNIFSHILRLLRVYQLHETISVLQWSKRVRGVHFRFTLFVWFAVRPVCFTFSVQWCSPSVHIYIFFFQTGIFRKRGN